jgi:hypothetical protein
MERRFDLRNVYSEKGYPKSGISAIPLLQLVYPSCFFAYLFPSCYDLE